MKTILSALLVVVSISAFAADYDVCTIVSGTGSSTDTTHSEAFGINCLDSRMTNLKIAEFDDTDYSNHRKIELNLTEARMKVIQFLLKYDYSKLEQDIYIKRIIK